jgi:regulator of protease activity HflC (stomatin/prohibitin superfamily)
MKNLSIEKFIAIGIAAVLVIVIAVSSITFIPTGYTGVRVTFGQVNETPAPAGLNFKVPFVQSIKKVNNKMQDITIADQIWAETTERTAVYFEGVTVTYSISGSKSAWLYANVTDYGDLINLGLVSSAVKSVAKQSPVVEVTDRAKTEPAVMECLQNSMNDKFGEGVVTVHKVIIANIDFEQEYQAAVAAKQQAQIDYEKQQINNQKAVEKAEADAAQEIKKAQGEAEAQKIRAEAEAAANKKISESLTDEVLAHQFYEKWNGELPKVSGGTGVILPDSILE